MIQGKIIRVAGPVVDVQFTAGRLPALQEALTVTAEGTERTMEVAQHVNESTVRCIMLSASEGLGKGMEVTATGHGLTAPVGEATLGRMFDPLGRPIDGKGSVDDVPHWPIHRKAPSFAEQKPATEILETGIKVIDLLAPYAKGGKIGLFGGAGRSRSCARSRARTLRARRRTSSSRASRRSASSIPRPGSYSIRIRCLTVPRSS